VDGSVRAAHAQNIAKEQETVDETRQRREHRDNLKESVAEAREWLVPQLEHGHGDGAPPAAASFLWPAVLFVTEVRLCNPCSCQERLRRNGRGPDEEILWPPPRSEAGPGVAVMMDQQLLRGTVFVTNFRLVFVSREPDRSSTEPAIECPPRLLLSIPLVAMDSIEAGKKLGLASGEDYMCATLRIATKDTRVVQLLFDSQLLLLLDMEDAMAAPNSVQSRLAIQQCVAIHRQQRQLAASSMLSKLYMSAESFATGRSVRRPLRPFWRPFWLRSTYVTFVRVKKH
jgi:hypothetical protein